MRIEVWTLAYLDKKSGTIEFKELGQMDSTKVRDLVSNFGKRGILSSATSRVIHTSTNSVTTIYGRSK
jgi:hypothetical protein